MKTAVKVLIAAGLVAAATAFAAMRPMGAQGSETADLLPKDQSRLPAEGTNGRGMDYAGNLLLLAQAAKPSRRSGPMIADAGGPPGADPRRFVPPGGGPEHGSGRRVPQGFQVDLAQPPGPPPKGDVPQDRRACNETIDRSAGVAGYLKSKLHLDNAQKDAWQKIQQAAEPVVAKMRRICATLPDQPGPPPNFPAMMTMADRQFSVRAEFVHAILPPATALYDMLSPEQRSILDRLPPPVL